VVSFLDIHVPDERTFNSASLHLRGWLKPENRCPVPCNSFAEYAPEPNAETKKKTWFGSRSMTTDR
jgi:hypothetical protein